MHRAHVMLLLKSMPYRIRSYCRLGVSLLPNIIKTKQQQEGGSTSDHVWYTWRIAGWMTSTELRTATLYTVRWNVLALPNVRPCTYRVTCSLQFTSDSDNCHRSWAGCWREFVRRLFIESSLAELGCECGQTAWTIFLSNHDISPVLHLRCFSTGGHP